MSLYDKVVRPFAFQFDPERVHETAMSVIQRGVMRAPLFADPRLRQTLFGVEFPNPLGLAAGFDKNAIALNHWHELGFGFVEAGTITFHPQPGNPRPRLLRIAEQQALINRLGFNNDGARRVATRLAEARPEIPVGINLGKSKVTAVEEAAIDYAESFRLVHPFGAYFVVNVSSPNTPGLRSLQERGPLLEILKAMKEVNAERPIFVKVAPDLTFEALDSLIEVAVETKLTGIIATNTTISRPGPLARLDLEGGLSGLPLRDLANDVLGHIARHAPKEMILMGVGGIQNGNDLYQKISLGAHLAQVYTGWIYQGPSLIADALSGLLKRMELEGIKTLDELRGSAL